MKATFYLISNALDISTPEKKQAVLDLYDGYEIANHTKYHPYPYDSYSSETLTDFAGTDENGAAIDLYKRSGGGIVAKEDEYIRCVDAGQEELAAIFGENSVVGFVWPGGGPASYSTLRDYVAEKYTISRLGTGNTLNDATFALPNSWTNWGYNADHTNIYERAQAFDALQLSDSDSLRWLCIGVHPSDFVSDANETQYHSWTNLQNTINLFKDQSDDYWFAGNREIYDYVQAVNNLVITDTSVSNNSDVAVCILVNGKKVILQPHTKLGR